MQLRSALASESWDAVLAQDNLPELAGLQTLALVRAAGLDIPVILLGDAIDEERALAAMQAGASDCLPGSTLVRLAPALLRALEEAQLREAHRLSSRRLAESEERFRSLMALSSDWYWEQDEHFRFTVVCYSRAESRAEAFSTALGKTPWEMPYHDPDWSAHRAQLAAHQPFQHLELQPITRDGSNITVSVSGEPRFDADGRFLGYRGVGRDISDRKAAEQRLQRLNRLYAMVSGVNALVLRARQRDELLADACRIAVENGQLERAWIGIIEASGKALVPMAWAGLNDRSIAAIKGLFASSEGSLQGGTLVARAIRERLPMVANDLEHDQDVLFGRQYAAAGIHSMAVLPLLVLDKAIGVLVLHTGRREFFDPTGLKLLMELAGNIAFACDYIDQQNRLDYLAFYDALTGLANRRLFLDRMTQYVGIAAADKHKLAVFLIDLERFKGINDSLGREAGDSLLRQVAQWLVDRGGDAMAVARVGIDLFALVLPRVRNDGDVSAILESTIGAFLNHPFQLDGTLYRFAAKVGVAMFPDHGLDAATLIKHAEAALKKTKASGDRYLFYVDRMSETFSGRLGLENQLRYALDHEEFLLHYQPKFELGSGRLTGAEALIRWNRPDSGLMAPARFIPILEQTGLIHAVGRWALHTAIGEYLRWRSMGFTAAPIAVNVSPLQLRDRGFVGEIAQAISADAHAAAGLELELTESLIMEDTSHSVATLQALRAMGIRIAIDDFGTGFSSLSYLSKLPIDILKIDRSFVLELTGRADGATLVSVIINLAHALKLKAVAEGVESHSQLAQLRALGCDEIQGFLCGQPVPGEVFERLYLAAPPALTDV